MANFKVKQITNNQFEIRTKKGIYFQSYDTIICFVPYGTGKVQLDKYKYDYSKTTSKYRNQFLGKDTKEIEALIKAKTYVLRDLNN
jgi:hypothetical protein